MLVLGKSRKEFRKVLKKKKIGKDGKSWGKPTLKNMKKYRKYKNLVEEGEKSTSKVKISSRGWKSVKKMKITRKVEKRWK